MSRNTPRKSRHRHQPSNNGPRPAAAASDYESDAAAQYLDDPTTSSNLPPPPPPRDNTELSLRVLRRYQPSIRSILAIAANAVAYTFLESTQAWEKHGAEGTLFVCDLEPIVVPAAGGQQQAVLPHTSVFVLNRRSMDNLVIDLLRVTDCEVVGELIVFRLEDDGGANGQQQQQQQRQQQQQQQNQQQQQQQQQQGEERGLSSSSENNKKVLGLWIHADESNTREVHASLILAAWQQGRQALDAYIQDAAAEAVGAGAAPAGSQIDAIGRSDSAAAAGRQLNVADLFGQKNGG
ncbi:hypothetical protein VTK26DRAFT_6417 [Humicola hyalothermophila]